MHEQALAGELRGRHGVTSRARLRNAGLSDRVISALVGRGRLVAVGNGVLVDPAAAESLEQRTAIACATTNGVARFPTAGQLWVFRKSPRVADVHVLVPHHRHPDKRLGIVVHRCRDVPATDVVWRADGVVLTSPPQTIFDAAAWVSAPELESMIEQGMDRGNFTIATLWRLCARLRTNGRVGGAALAGVLAARPAWRRPARSDHELRLERAMLARGFPPLTREHPVEIAPGTIVHPDLGLPDDGFFVEVDHLTWHGGRLESAYDRWRDTKARLAGVNVERVTDIALDHHLDETVEDLWLRWQQIRAGAGRLDADQSRS